LNGLNDLNVLNLMKEKGDNNMNGNKVPKEHPGRILLEDYLAPRGISVFHLAKDIGVPARRLFEIVQGQRPITADIASRLAHDLGMSARYWLDLQARYEAQREGNRPNGYSRKQSLRYVG
jgi:antitoxin HigA-1